MSLTGARRVLGALLLWASAGSAAYMVAWTVRSHEAAHHLQVAAASEVKVGRGFDAASTCRSTTPRTGQVAGLLEVPSLGLKAPVEQGEGDAVLSAAIGHDPASVWPGADGTAVFAAHDVSYFAHIDTLRPGTLIRYVAACTTTTFRVTGHRVVPAGSPVADSRRPEVILDTCWPTNALWWTPDRLLVQAVEVSSRPTGSEARVAPQRVAPLAVPAPPGLVAQGLTLDTNPTLLGTLRVSGRPAEGFVESPAPLAVEEAALTAYYGGLHSLAAGNRAWWAAVAPGVAFPAGWSGAAVTGYLTRLTVTVVADGERVQGAVLAAEVELRNAAGVVTPEHLTVTTVVRRGDLLIEKWGIDA